MEDNLRMLYFLRALAANVSIQLLLGTAAALASIAGEDRCCRRSQRCPSVCRTPPSEAKSRHRLTPGYVFACKHTTCIRARPTLVNGAGKEQQR
jgi:hypothetical protein